MKNLTTFVLLLILSSIANGEVSTRVFLADANTPLELVDPNVLTDPNILDDPNLLSVYRDIMVGTKLTIIVDSNVTGEWNGGLYIEDKDREYGVLSARDYNDITLDWEGSHFEAAGDMAWVLDINDFVVSGFDLYSHDTSVVGDWFILDYTATNIGVCAVYFYDYGVSWDYPVYSHVFSHVRTRDFNQDTKVDFADLALLSIHWLKTGCSDPDWCDGTDLNTDGAIDRYDLMLFADYWLEITE
jgi:hypothetical protein